MTDDFENCPYTFNHDYYRDYLNRIEYSDYRYQQISCEWHFLFLEWKDGIIGLSKVFNTS